MANFLVTGGAGFIGSNIVKKLVMQGHSVRVVDNLLTGRLKNLKDLFEKIDFIEGDLINPEIADKAAKDMDYILHQAALPSVPRSVKDPIKSNEMNIDATLVLLEAARKAKVKRVVYAASSSAYGNQQSPIKTETLAPAPLSPYAVTKLCGEYYCKSYSVCFGLETVSLRYFNVFGPHQDPTSQYGAVIPKFIYAYMNDIQPVIYGDGQQTRDFTFVDNNVSANILAALSDKGNGETINIACGTSFSLLDILDALKKITGKDIPPKFEPPRKGDVRDSLADIKKAKSLINYDVIVSFEEGLKRTYNWFKENTDHFVK